jgi:hypothetical protein
MPTKQEMDDQGTFNNWLQSYQATRQALSDSVIALNNQLLDTPPDDQGPIQLAITTQQNSISNLDSDRVLFYAGTITMTPPSDETVQQLKAFADQADQMINNAAAADQVVQIAGKAASVYSAAVQKSAP